MNNFLTHLELLSPAITISALISVAAFSAILIATWVINKIVQRSLLLVDKKRKIPSGLAFLINKATKFTIYSIGALMALDKIGIKITPILASLGVGGLAISFAMKDSLTNIISGIMIMLYRPFSINDYIEFKTANKDFEGKITAIDLRYTTLETNEHKTLVPNGVIVSMPVVVKK